MSKERVFSKNVIDVSLKEFLDLMTSQPYFDEEELLKILIEARENKQLTEDEIKQLASFITAINNNYTTFEMLEEDREKIEHMNTEELADALDENAEIQIYDVQFGNPSILTLKVQYNGKVETIRYKIKTVFMKFEDIPKLVEEYQENYKKINEILPQITQQDE